jgi:hypothetical protein
VDIIYLLANYYPFWGVPAAYIIFELGNGYRRRGHMLQALFLLCITITLLALTVAFFWYNAFETITPAIKKIERKYLS